MRGTLEERFWAKVLKTDSCWLWIGAKNEKGYGEISRTRKDGPIPVHRLALQWKLGRPIRPKMQALHHCDSPACVRDEHLYEGTPAQNSADMVRRGRSIKGRKYTGHVRCGEESNWCKLTTEQVKAIRRAYVPWKFGMRKLAKQFNVADETIRKIVNRKSWAHLE